MLKIEEFLLNPEREINQDLSPFLVFYHFGLIIFYDTLLRPMIMFSLEGIENEQPIDFYVQFSKIFKI